MISVVRPNIQTHQIKAQSFGQRVGVTPSLRIHPDTEREILAGNPVAILNLGRRYPNFEHNKDLQLVLNGMKERNPENPVVKALSQHIDNWIETLTPKPSRLFGCGMHK